MAPQQPNFGYYGEQKRGFNWKVIAIILGGLVFIGIAISVIVALNGQNSIGTQSQHLGARLTNLSVMTDGAAKQLRSGDLQKINAETAIITSGVQADLASILPKKIDKSVTAQESDASDVKQLANAALAGTYDREYTAVLTQKLESINAVITEMYNKTGSKKTKAALNANFKNYQAILTNLEKLSV